MSIVFSNDFLQHNHLFANLSIHTQIGLDYQELYGSPSFYVKALEIKSAGSDELTLYGGPICQDSFRPKIR